MTDRQLSLACARSSRSNKQDRDRSPSRAVSVLGSGLFAMTLYGKFTLSKIESLHDDILMIICEQVCAKEPLRYGDAFYLPAWSDVSKFRMSNFRRVCRKFNSISKAIPHLWSHLDDRMPIEQLQQRLQLAQEARLSIQISYRLKGNCPCKCSRWELMKKHITRWDRLDIILPAAYPNSHRPTHDCLELLYCMDMPKATSLTVDLVGEADKQGETDIVHKFRWTATLVKTMIYKSDRAMMMKLPLPSLTVLAIKPSVYSKLKWETMFETIKRAAALNKITKLVLNFSETHMGYARKMIVISNSLFNQQIALNDLEEFVLVYEHPGDGGFGMINQMEYILAWLNTPRLKHFAFCYCRRFDSNTLWRMSLRPSLETIRVLQVGSRTFHYGGDVYKSVLKSVEGGERISSGKLEADADHVFEIPRDQGTLRLLVQNQQIGRNPFHELGQFMLYKHQSKSVLAFMAESHEELA